MSDSIGIIAGSGQFPFLVARAARAEGKKVYICGFINNTDPALAGEADGAAIIGLGQLGRLIDFFKSNGVGRLCMAGAISKPNALDLKPDLRAAKFLFKIRRNLGDDSLLSALAAELRGEGLEVVPAAGLVPGLRAGAGALTRRAPSDEDWAAIRYGWPICKSMGRYDIGQTLVVRQAMVAAVEAMEGTDAALERGGSLGGKGCVAVKTMKPGQDSRLDLPSIGLATMEILARYQYSCLAYEAGCTLFFDRDEAVALADRHGIAVIGIEAGDPRLEAMQSSSPKLFT